MLLGECCGFSAFPGLALGRCLLMQGGFCFNTTVYTAEEVKRTPGVCLLFPGLFLYGSLCLFTLVLTHFLRREDTSRLSQARFPRRLTLLLQCIGAPQGCLGDGPVCQGREGSRQRRLPWRQGPARLRPPPAQEVEKPWSTVLIWGEMAWSSPSPPWISHQMWPPREGDDLRGGGPVQLAVPKGTDR